MITTDGTTLLGSDDKAGIAVIMTAAAHLLRIRKLRTGRCICFTCDEEIGHGVDHVEIDKLAVVCGYTLDADGVGKVEGETFSADLAIVTVTGINTHPSIGKGAMVNAVRILSEFVSRMPTDTLAPEVTDGREGFLHPYQIQAEWHRPRRGSSSAISRRRTWPRMKCGSKRSPPNCGRNTRGPVL